MSRWEAHLDRWQQGWEIVKAIDRDNFGMCLDIYQILSKIWADVTSTTGKVEEAERILEEDIEAFLNVMTIDKVFFVQLSDAERLNSPLSLSHPWYTDKQEPNMTLSRSAQICALEEKGYLPCVRLFEAWVFERGYCGWVLFEIFNQSMSDSDSSVRKSHAERGAELWRQTVY
jgi:4-hydroxyphenylpyruvate dioxygenase